jgi:hypothetical protein
MKAPDVIPGATGIGDSCQGHASPSTGSCGWIAPRVIALIDLGRVGISHLQRLPASITRAAIRRRFQSKENSQIQSLVMARVNRYS